MTEKLVASRWPLYTRAPNPANPGTELAGFANLGRANVRTGKAWESLDFRYIYIFDLLDKTTTKECHLPTAKGSSGTRNLPF